MSVMKCTKREKEAKPSAKKPINPQRATLKMKNKVQYPLQIYPNMSCREERQTTALKDS
jgi:hypothetical protein